MQQRFEFRPSRQLAVVLVGVHVLACLALLPLALPLWAKLALPAVLIISAAYHLWRYAWLRAGQAVTSLVVEGDEVRLLRRDGTERVARVMQDSLVTPLLSVLILLPEGARRACSVVILADSLDAESYRRLRVWLRWGLPKTADAAHKQGG